MTNGAIQVAPFGVDFAGRKRAFLQRQRSSSGGCSGLIVQLPWNEGFGVLGRKLDNLQGFTPLLGVPEVILDLLTQPTFGAGVKRDG